MKILTKEQREFLALAERVHEILQRRHWKIRWTAKGWSVDASEDRSLGAGRVGLLLDMHNACPFAAVDAAETWLMFAEGCSVGSAVAEVSAVALG